MSKSAAYVSVWKLNKKRYLVIPCDINPELELDIPQGLVIIKYRVRQ